MKPRVHFDPDEPERLRSYADSLERIGKHSVASMWREMADRIESRMQAASSSVPVRIYFNSANDPANPAPRTDETLPDKIARGPAKGRRS
jgi:hypothetical protein